MAQALHWIIVLLVLCQFVIGFYAKPLPVGIERLQLLTFHKSLGLTTFALVLIRVAWRFYTPPPLLPASMQRWQQRLAQLSHLLLYGLLLALPILGWLTSNASNLTVRWFFLFNLPNLTGPDRELARITKDLHDAGAWLLLATVCVHVSAALWHALVLKDDVFRRMLPLSTSDPERP